MPTMRGDWQMYLNDHLLKDTLSHDELALDDDENLWPHPALATFGTRMPTPDIYMDDADKPLALLHLYSDPKRTPRVRRKRWAPECVPQPVSFVPPNGKPVYKATPANHPYEFKDGGKPVDIDCDDPLVLAYDPRVQYPRAPPIVGKEMAEDFILPDRRRTDNGFDHWLKRNVTRRLANWKENAPIIRLDVSLDELTANNRLKKAVTIAEGHKRALHMQANPDQYLVVDTSAIIQDRNGNTLISVLGPDPIAVETLSRSMQDASRAEVVQNVRAMDMSHSPILPEVMDDFMQKTKMILEVANYPPDSGTNSRHKPNTDGRLPRHYSTYKLSDEFVEQLRLKQLESVLPGYTPAPFETTFRETASTCHWIHEWHMNGHRTTNSMTTSSDMWGNGRAGVGGKIHAYHEQTAEMRRILREVAEVTMPPEQFKRYSAAYEAGNIVKDLPGIFLGQVVVSGCYSYTHADSMDGEGATCMTFSSYGHQGTYMIFPELGTMVRYDPTDLLVFRSAELLHFVSDWEATQMQPDDVVTPGRTACVFFTPGATLRELEGQQPRYFQSTGNGLYATALA